MNVQYLVLHKLTSPYVFRLKGGPKLITKEQLKDTPHKMKDQEINIYLLFQIEQELPEIAARINQHVLTHPQKGYTVRWSYVTEIYSMMASQ